MNKEKRVIYSLIFVVIILSIINFMCTPNSDVEQNKIKSTIQQIAPPDQAKEPLKEFEYRKATEISGATSYIFEDDKKPKLNLNINGTIANLSNVNALLTFLDLPKVTKLVPERSSITGYRFHRAQYYWEDYPLGNLTINRSICGSGSNQYDCVWKVIVSGNKKEQ
ncbi:MAG: hypothetical protein RIG62_26260 [Cyclobacteriaceae bacterium]